MIIYNFNFKCIRVIPNKTYSKLIIDSNAVLIFSITFKFFKSICWWN